MSNANILIRQDTLVDEFLNSVVGNLQHINYCSYRNIDAITAEEVDTLSCVTSLWLAGV